MDRRKNNKIERSISSTCRLDELYIYILYIITSISESKHLHCMCGCVRERAGRSEGGFLHRRKLHSARHSPRNKTSWGIKATSHSNIGTSVTSVNDCWFSYNAIKQAIEHRSRQCCRCDHVKPNGADPCTKKRSPHATTHADNAAPAQGWAASRGERACESYADRLWGSLPSHSLSLNLTPCGLAMVQDTTHYPLWLNQLLLLKRSHRQLMAAAIRITLQGTVASLMTGQRWSN